MSQPRAVTLATDAVLWHDDFYVLACLYMMASQDKLCCAIPQALAYCMAYLGAEQAFVELLLDASLHFFPAGSCLIQVARFAFLFPKLRSIVLFPGIIDVAVRNAKIDGVSVPFVEITTR